MSDRSAVRPWWGLAASVAVFLGALGWHNGWFGSAMISPAPATMARDDRNEWFGIYQHGEKIGYAHRRLVPTSDGYRLTDNTLMRINAMGLVQEIALATGGTLNPDLSLRAFDVRLTSSRFSFHADGTVGDGEVSISVDGRRTTIPVQTPVFLTNTVIDAAAAMDAVAGDTFTVRIFDPAAMAQRPVRVHYQGDDVLTVRGRSVPVRHLVIELLNTRQNVWQDVSGRVVKEEGPLGMTLLAETPESARSGVSVAPVTDLTRLVAVPVSGDLKDPHLLKRLVLRIDGLAPDLDVDGGRQRRSGDRVTLIRETVPATPAPPVSMTDELAPSPLVQSDAPAIVAAAESVTAGAASDAEKARRLVDWVYRLLRKQPVMSVPNALEVLENKVGDCNEHAVLLAALGRAAGIPTRIEAGLVFMKGQFYYHAWNAFYLGRWVTADAVFNQMPADISHLRLVIGGLERQIDLMGVIGRIDIAVEEAVYD